ncbi:MAG: ABC transporter ATP-binding protein [Spirochaetia bacterium]
MYSLKICDLSKTFYHNEKELHVLSQLNIALPRESLITIVGYSGSGKTTLLRIISGLEKATSGYIQFSEKHPKVGFVFQEPRLFPWLNLLDNIQFLSRDKNPQKAHQILDLLGLCEYAQFFPHQISGGMAHRIGLGRILFYNPHIILMDEPFAALDYFTRAHMQKNILEIFQELKTTILFVTHNLEEAIILGDRLLIIKDGTLNEPFSPVTLQQAKQDPMAVQNIKNQLIAQLSADIPK